MNLKNRRHLQLMLQSLENYKDHKISLYEFISKAENYYRQTHEMSEEWYEIVGDQLVYLDSIVGGVPESWTEKDVSIIIFRCIYNFEKLVTDTLLQSDIKKVSLQDLEEKLRCLFADKATHEDTANWAYALTEEHEKENLFPLPFKDKKFIMDTLLFMCEIDHRDHLGNYRTDKKTIQDKIDQVKQKISQIVVVDISSLKVNNRGLIIYFDETDSNKS